LFSAICWITFCQFAGLARGKLLVLLLEPLSAHLRLRNEKVYYLVLGVKNRLALPPFRFFQVKPIEHLTYGTEG